MKIKEKTTASAIIVAGGQGRRMAADIPKQYLMIGKEPIWHHTTRAFIACESIQKIIVVVPQSDCDERRQEIVQVFGTHSDIEVVAGGKRRQDSVYNGLLALGKSLNQADTRDVVAVHDGVRPFVRTDQIDACVETARIHGACILAIPAFDTLKRVNHKNEIENTLERRNIWMAQTPQAFHFQLITKAHEHAYKNDIEGTDDAGLVEHLGHNVKIVTGSRLNLKITTPEDFKWAQAMLRG